MAAEMNDLIRAAALGGRWSPAEHRTKTQPLESDAGAREHSTPSPPPDINTVLRAAVDASRGQPSVLLRGRPIA